MCEILSPATPQVDRTEKMPLYAQHQVSPAWLIDPILRTLVLGVYAKAAKVRAEPFSEIELDLGLLWLE